MTLCVGFSRDYISRFGSSFQAAIHNFQTSPSFFQVCITLQIVKDNLVYLTITLMHVILKLKTKPSTNFLDMPGSSFCNKG